MATLQYDENGRLMFTEEMRQEYTILMPQMLPIHFTFLRNILRSKGYNVELLTTTHSQIVVEGLQSVHNDTCYPALLVIGQMIDALKSGKYDINKVALIITQTGGGCRASNYIHLLRKALEHNGMAQVPVISFNLYGMENNPGFHLEVKTVAHLIYAVLYGDLIMWVSNQTRPYELHKGDTDALIDTWVTRLSEEVQQRGSMYKGRVWANWKKIVREFSEIPMDRSEKKIRVGIVGEIYVKYAPLGNNNLEAFLQQEGAEVAVPGLLDFIIYCTDARITDRRLFGGSRKAAVIARLFQKFLINLQDNMIRLFKQFPLFDAPFSYEETAQQVRGYVGQGNKMGEGWLLTGEMLELVHIGINNIICTQPFGCLPNHIVGKGMIRKIRENHPEANIVAIDYDPGATKINQENRIKLMLATARRNQKQAEDSAEEAVS